MTDKKEEASELIRRIRQGIEPEANLRRLCELYLSSVDIFFLRQGVQQKDREDLTQNVFLNVCKSIGNLRDEDRFEGWLFTTARNIFLTYVTQSEPMGDTKLLSMKPLWRWTILCRSRNGWRTQARRLWKRFWRRKSSMPYTGLALRCLSNSAVAWS